MKDVVPTKGRKREVVLNPMKLANSQLPAFSRIYLFEKDSRRIYDYSILDNEVKYHTVFCDTNFPHNFQTCQTDDDTVYLIGGGDFNQIVDAMFQMRLLVPRSSQMFGFEDKQRMKFARHGHSTCHINGNVIVTGSRKDSNNAPERTELYMKDSDIWIELPRMKKGRHYHSSTAFNNQAIYIFCGISHTNKKYINTIEKLNYNATNP